MLAVVVAWAASSFCMWYPPFCRCTACVQLKSVGLTCIFPCTVAFRTNNSSVEDYWQGYKLFCFAFYSHSVEHEIEFRHSKLGALASLCCLFICSFVLVFVAFPVAASWMCVWFLSPQQCFRAHRAACVQTSFCSRTHFPSLAPRHLHANSSSC